MSFELIELYGYKFRDDRKEHKDKKKEVIEIPNISTKHQNILDWCQIHPTGEFCLDHIVF